MLLASLRYSGMNDREERISEAHETTFQWLLKDSDTNKWVSFKDWLESNDKLYWITGKAGSGKSTLIKYICCPVRSAQEPNPVPRCRQFLETWSGDKDLVIASFYFWNSGIQTQMTQRGLLMSLLHQILNQCPQLAPLACPDRWESLGLFGEDLLDWDDQELRDTLCWVTKNINQVNSTVALFVDGLDEFQGKPEELISLFKDIVDYSNIKLCVASRPWVQFEDAFEHRPFLKLQDLTYDDIKSFVASKFHSEPMFAQLRRREEEFADQLIESIVVKADGVFLWVTLVVSSLIAGMNAGDRVSDFMRRLDQLPPDLSKLYEKMLLSLDHFYLDHASQLFSLVRTSSIPMNVVLASFVDEDDPSFALRQPCRPLSKDETVLRMDTMRRRINSRSKGLLEVKGPEAFPGRFENPEDPCNYSQYTVQYLHRTVKDYIESDEAQMILQPAARSPIDPHLRLLAGHIAYIKRLDPDRISAPNLWRDNLQESLKLARSVSPGCIPQMVLLLDEMDKIGRDILRALAARRRRDESTAIPKSILWAYHQTSFESLDRGGDLDDFKHTFLSLTVIFGVVEYVRVKAEAGCLIRHPHFDTTTTEISYCGEWPLLMDAVMYGASSMYITWVVPKHVTGPNHKMIQCLLEKSADPNYLVSAVAGEETSPLIESVSQLMLFVSQDSFFIKQSEKEHFWIESTRLLARAGRLDKDTIDRALVIFLEKRGLRWLPFRFHTFIQRAHAKKLLRKSLQTLVEGGNPNICTALAEMKRFTRNSPFSKDIFRKNTLNLRVVTMT
ncbi:NACHT domain-containing protein isoform 2 [Cladophialophora immunda]|nr:NACHT domain-containing protein isoform 2 [Cladophialophora immunda]